MFKTVIDSYLAVESLTVLHTKVSYDHTRARPELGGGTLEGSKRVVGSWYRRGEISMVLGVELSDTIPQWWAIR